MTDSEIMRRIGEAYRRYGLDRTFSREELLGEGNLGTGKERQAKRESTATPKHEDHLQRSLPREEKGAA